MATVEARALCVVLTTAGSAAQADTLARELVERRLAACVNVVPGARSYFRWDGKLTLEDEVLLVIKTSRARTDELRRTLRELHTYETPEFIVLGLEDGDADYLAWLAACVQPGG